VSKNFEGGEEREERGAKTSKRGGRKVNNRGCKLEAFKGHLLHLGMGRSEVGKSGEFFNVQEGVGVTMLALSTGREGFGLNDIGKEVRDGEKRRLERSKAGAERQQKCYAAFRRLERSDSILPIRNI